MGYFWVVVASFGLLGFPGKQLLPALPAPDGSLVAQELRFDFLPSALGSRTTAIAIIAPRGLNIIANVVWSHIPIIITYMYISSYIVHHSHSIISYTSEIPEVVSAEIRGFCEGTSSAREAATPDSFSRGRRLPSALLRLGEDP